LVNIDAIAFFYFYHVVGARIFANQQYCQAEKLVECVGTLLCRFVREAVADSSLPEGGVAKVE